MSRHHSKPVISVEITYHKNQRDFSEISSLNMFNQIVYSIYYLLF